MKNIIVVNKPIGKTPLEMIDELKRNVPDLKDKKIAYAGRLDPMAEGLLLLLVGEECKKRDEYEKLSKEYEFEILFGFATDTYDVMGMVQEVKLENNLRLESMINEQLPTFLGKQIQPYPPFSSARVNGKPLYYWARQGKLDEIQIPTKEIEIYSISLLSKQELSGKEILNIIQERISKVKGEFRQEEIINKWTEVLNKKDEVLLPIFKLKVSCSSGTYVRSIANELGRKMNIPTVTFSIKRTRVGEYTPTNI